MIKSTYFNRKQKKINLAILFFLSCFFSINSIKADVIIKGFPVPKFKKDTVSISTLGAIGDGQTMNTLLIQHAIDSMYKRGGGVVLIPNGLWLSGPIVLKNNINLSLERGATLMFSDKKEVYPLVAGNWEGLPQMRNQSPISATGASNIAITGKGIIDGNGAAWRMVKKEKLTESEWKKLISKGGVVGEDKKSWYPSAQFMQASMLKNPGAIEAGKDAAFYESIKDFLRPNLLVLLNCKNILLEGVTFQNSPAWCLHPLMSENITVRNILVKNPWFAQNGDGIDLESCKNVLIENSVFDVGDDALCMKSGRDEAGRKRGMPTENVTIKGCTVYSAHGGFVVGSEMSGGVRNIRVDNCTFIGTDIGLRFKTARGRGGVVENIDISNIYMKGIQGEAILFDMYYMAKDPILLNGEKGDVPIIEKKPFDESTPIFKNIKLENVYCEGAEKAIFIRGLPEMHIRNIQFKNMALHANTGIDIQEATNIHFNNVKIFSDAKSAVVELMQSDSIYFDKVELGHDKAPLFKISGPATKDIHISNTAIGTSKEKIIYSTGANQSAIKLINTAVTDKKTPYSILMSSSAIQIWPDSFMMPGDKFPKWRYDQGVVLQGMSDVWKSTGNKDWFKYVQKSMDYYVKEDGSIKGYKPEEYNLDHLNNGKILLILFQATGEEKYAKAASLLRSQLYKHPRNADGGFWHKKIYPNQMWLDGLYMAQPFMAAYAKIFHQDSLFDDIAQQFILMEKHARDQATGLLYHGWDDSRKQLWANKETGNSPHFWSRSLGWFGMALVDVLDYFPVNHPKRNELVAILNRLCIAVKKVQDPVSGLWYDIPNKKEIKPNYPEASGSSMLTYTLAKGSRMGYLPVSDYQFAKKAYDGILKKFIVDSAGIVNLVGTVSVSGLGGDPYRDGSFAYYMKEPVVDNDPKGLGAFILCAAEMELNENKYSKKASSSKK
jgi:rhamnogalacturonyl hydrolase YesR/polygalacturonase